MTAISNIKEADWESEVINHSGDVLVDFWGENCAPCQALAPVIEEFANDYHEQIKVVKINFSDATETAVKLELRGLPTLYHFKDGKTSQAAFRSAQ